MNLSNLSCPQCHSTGNNIDADEKTVFHCYNCGYPDIDWKKESDRYLKEVRNRINEII